MKLSAKRWIGLLVCAAVFWGGLISLFVTLGGSDTPRVQLYVDDLTVTAVPSPDRPDDWRDWYEVRYTLENQSDRSLPLRSYDLVYSRGTEPLYPWTDNTNTALSPQPVLPAGHSVEICHLLYLSEGESARVSLRYDSWEAVSDTLTQFTLGE